MTPGISSVLALGAFNTRTAFATSPLARAATFALALARAATVAVAVAVAVAVEAAFEVNPR